MKLRILGCSGADLPGHRSSSYLIDRTLMVDAGVICSVLPAEEQAQIRNILVTHTHADHIKGLPSLVDNRFLNRVAERVEVSGSSETIDALRRHLFNDILWPDFTRIPNSDEAVLAFRILQFDVEQEVGGYRVTPFRVNHTVPGTGYLIRSGHNSLLFSGDTGPTDRLWELAGGVDALIVEVSFPNGMEQLARDSLHLTPRLLKAELAKARSLPAKILITHQKPQFKEQIHAELMALGITGMELLRDEAVYEFR